MNEKLDRPLPKPVVVLHDRFAGSAHVEHAILAAKRKGTAVEGGLHFVGDRLSGVEAIMPKLDDDRNFIQCVTGIGAA